VAVAVLWSPNDLLTSVLTPIGLAMARRPSLVIDLDPKGPRYSGGFTLADLARNGPTKAQLEPRPKAVAVLANGGVAAGEAADVIAALVERWPHVVLRCDPADRAPSRAVSIVPLLPEPFAALPRPRTVYQSLGMQVRHPVGSLVLPAPSRSSIEALIGLRTTVRRSRWLTKLGAVWEVV